MPIVQWLYFDALECLSEVEGEVPTEEECAPVSSTIIFWHVISYKIPKSPDAYIVLQDKMHSYRV